MSSLEETTTESTENDNSANKSSSAHKVHKNVKAVQEQNRYGCKAHPDAYLLADMSTGDRICVECGVVVEERSICEDAEWRNFDGDTMADKAAKNRAGDTENPLLSSDYNLGTIAKMMDQNKNRLSSFGDQVAKHYKCRSVDNALVHAFKEIDDMCHRIHVPSSVGYRAKQLYQEMYLQIKLKGNILLIDAKTAACLYVACRENGCARSTQEIAAIYDVKKRDLVNAIKRVVTTLHQNIPDEHGSDMVDRYCTYLPVSREQRKRAHQIAVEVDKNFAEKSIANKKKKKKKKKKKTNNLPPAEVIAGTSIYLATATSFGAITSREYAKTREKLRNEIGSVIGITPSAIDRTSNAVKDDLPLDLLEWQ